MSEPVSPATEVLSVKGLRTSYGSAAPRCRPSRTSPSSVRPGEIVGLVGESGSGKSTVAEVDPGHAQAAGRGPGRRDRVRRPRPAQPAARRSAARMRGGEMAMIFQDPINSFNPSWTIGSQFRRVLAPAPPDLKRSEYDAEIIRPAQGRGHRRPRQAELLPVPVQPGPAAADHDRAWPAASDRLKVLLADEPTTSLDVTIEAQVLELLRGLCATSAAWRWCW